LNVHQSASLAVASATLEAWRMDYNHHRPPSSLGHLTLTEFIDQRQAISTVEAVLCSGYEPSQNWANVRGIKPYRHFSVA